MPTLLERSKSLSDFASRLATADEEKAQFRQLTTRATQVRGARDELSGAKQAARLLETHGIHLSSVPQPTPALKAKAPALRTQLTEDWRSLAGDHSLPITFIEPVKTHAAKLRAAALAAWQGHVDAGLPVIREGLITALRAAGFQAQCTRLQQLRDEVASLRRSCPISTEALRRLDELKAAIHAIWSELEGVPADVTNFLRKAARREAVIADLTPGIRVWLDDRGMLGQLRIGLG